MKLYTKKGDRGQASLFGGKRVLKTDLRVEIFGEVDELNSLIGVVLSKIQKSKFKNQNQVRLGQNYNSKVKSELIEIQKDLFSPGSILAKSAISNLGYLKNRIKNLEDSIDKMTEELPGLKNFVLPGGGEVGSFLHLARAVCRRTERRAVELSEREKVAPEILAYFNRLSDLLFIMARFVNFKEKQKEIVWFKK